MNANVVSAHLPWRVTSFCNPGFWDFPTYAQRAGVLANEMTHAYGDLGQDVFYYQQDMPALGWFLPRSLRMANADTYEMYYLPYSFDTVVTKMVAALN